ncbi:hypothetical protein V1478_009248 [Vespula squamosa]|uniref:Uncharacterized protein n=1 Tax=Vespula squamosa TaxID=30214 RepID=A0ABD2APF1_VESSQ
MDFHTQLPPCGEIRKSVLRTFVYFILYNVRTTGPKADVRILRSTENNKILIKLTSFAVTSFE